MLEVALTRLAVSLGALGEMNGDDAGGEQLNCSFVGREQGDVISKKKSPIIASIIHDDL